MSFSHWISVAALAVLPLAATAQQPQRQPNPADANAFVPTSTYVSAFKNHHAGTDELASPDKLWRAANEEVQTEGGHAGYEMPSAPGRQSQPQPATPKAAPHAGHDARNMGAK